MGIGRKTTDQRTLCRKFLATPLAESNVACDGMACLVVCLVGVFTTDQHFSSPGDAAVGRSSSRRGVQSDGRRRRHGSVVDHLSSVRCHHRRFLVCRHRRLHPVSASG